MLSSSYDSVSSTVQAEEEGNQSIVFVNLLQAFEQLRIPPTEQKCNDLPLVLKSSAKHTKQFFAQHDKILAFEKFLDSTKSEETKLNGFQKHKILTSDGKSCFIFMRDPREIFWLQFQAWTR